MVNCLWPSAILHARVQMGCRKVCNAMTGRIQDGNCQLPLPMLRRAVWNMTVRNMTTVNCRCQRYSVPTGTRWSEQWKLSTAILCAMQCRLGQDGAIGRRCQLPSSVLCRADWRKMVRKMETVNCHPQCYGVQRGQDYTTKRDMCISSVLGRILYPPTRRAKEKKKVVKN